MKHIDYFLVGFGLLYVVDPNVFRRFKWTNKTPMQRNLTPEKYNLAMRGIGLLMIIWGLSPLFYHPAHR